MGRLAQRHGKSTKDLRLLTVRNRLFFGTACMLLPLLITVVLSISAFNTLIDYSDELVHESAQELLPIVGIQADVQTILTVLHDDQSPIDTYLDLDGLISAMDLRFNGVVSREMGHIDEIHAFERARQIWRQHRDLVQQLPLLREGEGDGGLEKVEAALNAIHVELDVVVEVGTQELRFIHEQARKTRDLAGLKVGITLLIALLMASLFGHFLAQSILKPLAGLREGAEEFGRGNLQHRIVIGRYDELGKVAMAFNRMALRLDRSHRSLKRLSTRDYLTNLLNAREFYRLLDHEMERAERYGESFSLLLIDADHFKQINDTYGHQSGDAVLRELAKCLRVQVRTVDIPARVGGEEFAVVLPNTRGEAALAIAERIRQAVAASELKVGKDATSLHMTVSIGLATFPHSATDSKELFHQADMALYNAKQGGRNRVSIA